MQAKNLDIDLLRSFTAVADTGSFTAAGDIVARSQSAVSVQIKRLEESIGCKVFERTSRSLALTPSGEMLLGYARRMLELNDESFRKVAEPPIAGEFRLGITEYFVPGELTHILARFAASYPEVHLEVRMGMSRDLRSALMEGDLDAALVRAVPKERASVLWEEPQHWVAHEDFSLRQGAVVPLVALPERCVLRDFAIESLKKTRQPWRIAFTSSSMTGVQAAVLAGLGISIMPKSSILSGMRILPCGKFFPDPGHLEIDMISALGASKEIMEALDRSIRQTLKTVTVLRK